MGSSASTIAFVMLAAGLGQARAECAPGVVAWRMGAGPSGQVTVEIADTEALRARGLMMRKTLAPDAGMLFTYPAPRHVYYWMKDTLIPLDLVFLDQTGRVSRIKPQAQPGDLTPIDGGPDVRYVLEINGGLARTWGLAAGAEMQAAAMDPAPLAWPCP